MPVTELEEPFRTAVYEAMVFVARGPELEEWEFHTRMGIYRPELEDALSRWPELSDADRDSPDFLAVNNSLNEVCHGLPISDEQWREWFTVEPEIVAGAYRRWALSVGLERRGIQ
ncbi:MAG: hypothetical protein ACK47B_19890 [Armatimonadota bacterium]